MSRDANTSPAVPSPPSLGLVIAAFAAVYTIWGSTYLAIRFAVETLPPFLMAGVRFLTAGVLMYALVVRRTEERGTRQQWRSAFIIGGLLLLGGNGLVTWAEQTVPSSVAALLVTMVPIWMVLLHWFQRTGVRPTLAEAVGVGLGFSGVALLIGTEDLGDGSAVDRVGAAALVLASLSWAFGSLYSRNAPLPRSPLLSTSMQMVGGGVLLVLVGLLRGETSSLEFGRVSGASVIALVYLILFGSLVGFTAYSWLLRVSTPARVSTYAFVNPMVAVFLGCTIGKEPFSSRFLAASAIIIAAVVLIITSRSRARAVATGATVPAGPVDPDVAASSKQDGQHDAGALPDGSPLAHGCRVHSLDALVRAQRRSGRAYLEFLRVEAMSMGLYRLPAGGVDPQAPHCEDEVYYVVSGKSMFRMGDELRPVGAGDVLYVPARVAHRFEAIVEDLTILVVFAPAEHTLGGSAAEPVEAGCGAWGAGEPCERDA